MYEILPGFFFDATLLDTFPKHQGCVSVFESLLLLSFDSEILFVSSVYAEMVCVPLGIA